MTANPHGGVVAAIMTGFDSYQLALLRGMRRTLHQAGLSLIAHVNEDQSPVIPDSLACLLSHMPLRGVVTTNAMSAGQEAQFRSLTSSRGVPVVNIGQVVPGETCFRADNVQGMTALMEHLLDECQVRSPVLIRGVAHQPDHVERETVFRSELARRGIVFDEAFLVESGGDRDVAFGLMSRLLEERHDLDAVVTMDDWTALSIIGAVQAAGLRVPDDVVVTGFDNYPIGSLTWPGLTSVDQELEEQGALAAAILLEQMVGAQPRGEVLTPCRLVVRGTTGGVGSSGNTDALTAHGIAAIAHEHLSDQGAMLRLSRALLTCRTLEDTCTVLARHLPALRVHRCFLVVFDEGSGIGTPAPDLAGGGDGVPHRSCRLVLDYRDGRAHELPDGTFSSCGYLPPALRDELTAGYLGYQGIITPRGKLGYLLLDHDFGAMPIVEPLRLDLGRAITTAADKRELEAHAAELEQLVLRRTQDLEAEVAVRREAEARLQRTNEELTSTIALRLQAENDLQRANSELQRLLALDGLTRIPNRTAMERRLAEQWACHVEDHAELSVLMIDVDMFKAYNDHYGHLLGDQALRTVASCLEKAVRPPDDLACRFGGEEFIALLPRTDLVGARLVAERFRTLLALAAVSHEASPVRPYVTVSIGIAVTRPSAELTPEMLVARADQALYDAKRQGRDTVADSVLTAVNRPGERVPAIPRQVGVLHPPAP